MANSATVGLLRVLLTGDSAELAQAFEAVGAEAKELGQRLQKDLEPRQRAVNAAVRDFLGGNEIRKAEEYARAVKEIGGANQLTATDQARVNKTLQEALAHYKALGTQAPAHLLALESATRKPLVALTALGKIQQHVRTQGQQMAASVRDIALGYVSGQAALSAFTAAGRKVVDFFQDSIGEALEAERAERRLTTALQQQGAALPEVLDLYEQLAQKYQSTTIFSADLIREQQTLLTMVGGVLPREMDAALEAVTNLASGLGVDLESATMMVAKAFEDNFSALGKAGVQIDATRAKAEGMVYVLDQVNARFGGQAQADLQTYTGQLKALENQYADLKEQVGKAVLETGVLDHAMMAAKVHIALTAAEIEGLVNWMSAFATMAEGGFSTTAIVNGLALVQARADATAESGRDVTGVIEGLSRSLDKYDVKGMSPAQKKFWEETGKAARDAAQAQGQAITALVDQITGAGLADEIRRIEEAYRRLTPAQRADAEVMERLALEVAKVSVAGGTLTPTLNKIWQTSLRMNRELDKTVTALELADTKQRAYAFINELAARGVMAVTAAEQKRLTANAQQLFLQDAQRRGLEEYNAVLAHLAYLQSVATGETEDATDATKEYAVSTAEAFDAVADGFEQLAQITQGDMSDIARGVGAAASTVKILDKSFDQLGKAEGPAELTAGIFGVVGALAQGVGMAIELGKAIHDAATRSESEKAAADIRRNFGALGVTEDSQVAQDVERLVNDLGIDRNLAIDLSLPDIIAEGGGLTGANFTAFRDRAAELFDDIRLGGEVGERALQALDDTLGQLGEHVAAQGGVWDREFVAMLERAQFEGLELASVMELVKGQMDIAGSGVSSAVGGEFSGAFAERDRLSGVQQDRAGAGDRRGAEAAAAELAAFTKATVAESADDFERLSRITLATFNAQIASGRSAAEAVASVGPAIDTLTRATTDFGFAGNAAFEELRRWRELTTENAGLLEQVTGLNDVMLALANVGRLDAQTFANLQAQGSDAFAELTAAGFSQTEALAQIAPMLETIRTLHEERGLAIDTETQSLIDQAEAQGVLAEQAIDETGVQLDLTAALVQAIGGELPESYKKWRAAATETVDAIAGDTADLASTVQNELGPAIEGEGKSAWEALELQARESAREMARIAQELAGDINSELGDLDFNIGFHVEELPEGLGVPQLGKGGIVRRPTLAIIGEDGPEAVVPLGRGAMDLGDALIQPSLSRHGVSDSVTSLDRVGRNTGAALSAGGTVILEMDGRMVARATVPHIPGEVRRYALA